jgi:hypothetical protein
MKKPNTDTYKLLATYGFQVVKPGLWRNETTNEEIIEDRAEEQPYSLHCDGELPQYFPALSAVFHEIERRALKATQQKYGAASCVKVQIPAAG